MTSSVQHLDDELAALTAAAVTCRGCGTPFPKHNGGGAVRVTAGGFASPAAAVPVTCLGFRWVDLDGPPVGSYSDPPTPSR